METLWRDFRVGKEPRSEPGENPASEVWIKEDKLLEEPEKRQLRDRRGTRSWVVTRWPKRSVSGRKEGRKEWSTLLNFSET